MCNQDNCSTPYGFCHCGCGEITTIAPQTVSRQGRKKGEPIRFVHGHNRWADRRDEPDYVQKDCGFQTPCWIWQWGIRGGGYGRIWVDGVSIPAHRHFYEQRFGKVPEGVHLDHLCRNRSCVNPDHLEPVSGQVNTQRGDSAKLDADDIREIRRLRFQEGMTYRAIAKRFPVCNQNIARICLGQAWANVE